MKFLDGFDDDIKAGLLNQFRSLWTHTSTAIEGNTLTLGETDFVLKEGLTIKGKPLKDHKDVEGHAKAVDLVMEFVKKDSLSKEDLFRIHSLVISEIIYDVYKPIGNWRNDFASTDIVKNGKQGWLEYPNFLEIPDLMDRWIELFNENFKEKLSWSEAKKNYIDLHISFVVIHPFFDGNGRMARLVSNLPVLKSGYPPIVINATDRSEYIQSLQEYTNRHGVPSRGSEIIFHDASLKKFISVVDRSYMASRLLVNQAETIQRRRNQKRDHDREGR